MTLQDIFTKVVAHLLTQGERSFGFLPNGGSTGCLYRGKDNTKCAVGCLIPDELYRSHLENTAVNSPEMVKVLQIAGVLNLDGYSKQLDLLVTLQDIHDSTSPEEWPDALARCGRGFDLTMPEVPNA